MCFPRKVSEVFLNYAHDLTSCLATGHADYDGTHPGPSVQPRQMASLWIRTIGREGLLDSKSGLGHHRSQDTGAMLEVSYVRNRLYADRAKRPGDFGKVDL